MGNRYYLQITSGRGPVECCRVVALLVMKIIDWSQLHQYKCELVESEEGPENGTLFSAHLAVENCGLETLRNEWEGSVLWVAQSIYRPHHKRKNWFVGCKVYEIPSVEAVDTSSFVYETLRSSGPGGQHVNKTESAVRVRDKITGLSVVAMEQRSQMQNKKLATERLLIQLSEREAQKQTSQRQQNWDNHNHLQRGNAIKVFKEKM